MVLKENLVELICQKLHCINMLLGFVGGGDAIVEDESPLARGANTAWSIC